MFTSAERHLQIPWARARQALDWSLADGGLVEESRRAEATGMSYEMNVGPSGARGVTRRVVVRVGVPAVQAQHLTLAIRWEAPGASGAMYPALDADLTLSPEDDGTRIAILARYEPPLGALGRLVDRVVLGRVASATMEEFVREIGEKILEVDSQHTRDPEPG